jgi:glycine hydroxymethyltransferase
MNNINFLQNVDKDEEISSLLDKEYQRQENHLELIASENYASKAVMQAQGSYLTNKYAEGYPGKRYYGGCEYVDEVETIAIERLKKLFNVGFANVQPHSGSQANQSVFIALLKAGDTILGMDLSAGGHLTHGAQVNISGKLYNAVTYGVNDDGLVDYDEVRKLALEHKPKLVIAGASAYSRHLDWKKFSEIAKEVGAYFMADAAHYSGLIVAGLYPSPVGYADVITSTTHKTLRGPRGGIVMTDSEELIKKINSAIFPGIQGGPLMHVIAAKAVCFKEALSPEFKVYAQQVLDNARAMAQTFKDRGFGVVSDGTDSHMFLLDLRDKTIKGKMAQEVLDSVGITVNKNSVPKDPEKFTITSGIRIGTPALTTRGFKEKQVSDLANWIADVLENQDDATLEKVRKNVAAIAKEYPVYK